MSWEHDHKLTERRALKEENFKLKRENKSNHEYIEKLIADNTKLRRDIENLHNYIYSITYSPPTNAQPQGGIYYQLAKKEYEENSKK